MAGRTSLTMRRWPGRPDVERLEVVIVLLALIVVLLVVIAVRV